MENTTIIVLAIKEFISLIFIHNIRKNLTSSTVFAFITIKASQAHKTIINIIKTTQRNQTNCPKLTFWAAFFSGFSSIAFSFKNNFSQKFPGTTFVNDLNFFPSTSVSQVHSWVSFVSQTSKFEIVFAFITISV